MIWRRAVLLSLLTLSGLLVETTLLGSATLAGTKPELILLITIALALGEGSAVGAVAGFVGGVATDLLLDLPAGLSALVFTGVGYAVGAAREHFQTPAAWVPMGIAGAATAAGVFAYGAVGILFGQETITGGALARHAGLAAGYNVLLAPFVIPVVRGLAARMRPRKVVRL